MTSTAISTSIEECSPPTQEQSSDIISLPPKDEWNSINGAGGIITEADELMMIAKTTTNADKTERNCCEWRKFQGKRKAQGFAFAAAGHGSIIVSNAFLSSSLTYLANMEAGCLDETGAVIQNCDKKIFGFSPQSLLSNIFLITALLVAFLLPAIGAVIDFSPHRRRVGICVAALIFLIQATQIGTVARTWFPMAILQCIAGALYNMHYALTASYLPDITRFDVDPATFASFNRIFYSIQFGGEVVFILLVVGLATALGFNGIQMAQLSQGIAALWLVWSFGGAWSCFPDMSRRHALPSNHSSTFIEGFRQNWRTAKAIAQQSPTLKWFFTAVAFGEAGSSALLPIIISILANYLSFNSTQVVLCFLIALLGAIPGTKLNALLCGKFSPIRSTVLSLIAMTLVTTLAMIHFPLASESSYTTMGFVYSSFWGLCLGWWYSGENLLFSFLMPAGQESELSGFFVYCTIIMTWFPPLIFTVIVEQGGIQSPYGLASLIFCQLLGIIFLFQMPAWDDCLQSAKKPLMMLVDFIEQEEE